MFLSIFETADGEKQTFSFSVGMSARLFHTIYWKVRAWGEVDDLGCMSVRYYVFLSILINACFDFWLLYVVFFFTPVKHIYMAINQGLIIAPFITSRGSKNVGDWRMDTKGLKIV